MPKSKATRERCTAGLGKVPVCNAAYGNNDCLGLASIKLDSNGNISQATQKKDGTYALSFAEINEKYPVMCQEVGENLDLSPHSSMNKMPCLPISRPDCE